MYYYILAFCATIILGTLYSHYLEDRKFFANNIVATLFVTFPMIVLSANRWMVGTDFNSYLTIFDYYGQMSLSEYLSKMTNIGPAFFVITKVCYIANSVHLYFGVSSFLFFYFILKGIRFWKKESGEFVIPLEVILLLFFPHALNITRQMIAVAILFYASKYLIKEKSIAYFGLLIVALTFHISALIGFAIFILFKINKLGGRQHFLWATFVIILEIVLMFVLNRGIALFNMLSVDVSRGGEVSGLQVLLQIIPLLICLLFDKYITDGNYWDFNKLMLINSLLIYVVFYSYTWAFRISYYFSVFQVTMSAQIFKTIDKKIAANKFTANGMKLFFSIIYIVIFYILFVFLKFDGILPYKVNYIMR